MRVKASQWATFTPILLVNEDKTLQGELKNLSNNLCREDDGTNQHSNQLSMSNDTPDSSEVDSGCLSGCHLHPHSALKLSIKTDI